jgi:hypothetical protein
MPSGPANPAVCGNAAPARISVGAISALPASAHSGQRPTATTVLPLPTSPLQQAVHGDVFRKSAPIQPHIAAAARRSAETAGWPAGGHATGGVGQRWRTHGGLHRGKASQAAG